MIKCYCGNLHNRPRSLFCSKQCSDKSYKLFTRYDMTPEQWAKQLEEQGGVCAICQEESDTYVVDHNHKTGLKRKLLCNACNLMLGFAKDDINVLASAILYLNEET